MPALVLLVLLSPDAPAQPASRAGASPASPTLLPGEAALLRVTPGRRPAGYDWHLPRGFPTPAVPADNPMSDTKVRLGRRLFFEPRLSSNGRYSCASCHDPRRAYTDGRRLAVGATGAQLSRNAMALVNVAYNLSYGWQHPEVTRLEQQMRQPLFNVHPVELGVLGREPAVLRMLAADPRYARLFAAAFPPPASVAHPGQPDVVTTENLIKAIAAFERTLIFGDAPFDRYVFGGESDALGAAAKAGMALFFSARLGCSDCHSGFNFAGNWRDAQGATGPVSLADDGTGIKVRVPTLREIARTAPYMHDGRYATLDQVIVHYERAGRVAGNAPDRRLRRFTLTPSERKQLKAFLQSLSSGDPRASRDHRGPAAG